MKQIAKHIAIVLALVSALTITAQTYTKNVDVSVEIQPQLRAASRLDISPNTISKSFPASSLRFSSNIVTTGLTHMINKLQSLEISPVYTTADDNGYLVAGYFPWSDFGVSAGYRIVNTRSTRLNVWTQFNRNSYKEHSTLDKESPKTRIITTDFDLGLDISHTSRYGTLSAATYMYLSHFNYPVAKLDPSTQNVNRLRLGASWNSNLDESASGYSLKADIERFGYSKACFPEEFDLDISGKPKSLHEVSGNIMADGRLMFTNSFGMGLNIGYSNASLNTSYSYMPGTTSFHERGKLNRGVIILGAAFRFISSSFSGHIGPRFDISTGDNNGTHLGATGTISWNLSPYFTMFTTAESGTQLNTLGNMYQRNRYAAPLAADQSSYLDYDIKYGITAGTFKGLSITAQIGINKASNWSYPTLSDGISTFASTFDIKSLWYQIGVDYKLNKLLSIKASLEGVTDNSLKHAYYRWSDHANQVLGIDLTYRPIEPLTIEGGYNLRRGRKICSITTLQDDMSRPLTISYDFMSLGRINSGHIGATYTFDNALSIFGRIDGIGQKHYLIDGAVPGKRLSGLIGIKFSF